MRLKKHVLKAPIFILIFLIFYSCSITKNQRTKQQSSEGIFVYGAKALKDETYAEVKGSVARLRAMMCGKFTQYSLNADPKKEKYSVWLVNDGKDSVLTYKLPIGNHHKDGYWMYQCQVLTSLMEEPLNVSFIKLEEINRDSIKETYYKAPEGFEYSISEILENSNQIFKEINWEKLMLEDGYNLHYYIRQSPLEYIGESILLNSSTIHGGQGFMSIYYKVTPQKIIMGRKGYDKNKKYLKSSSEEWLLKEAMVHSDLLD